MMKSFLKKIIIFFLHIEARLVLRKYKPKIIAVTGSVGKTATKDAIYCVLSRHFFVHCSQKSFNSELGVPLAILGCQSGWNNPLRWIKIFFEGLALIFFKNHYPAVLVLEIGIDRPGDIKSITKWLHPDVVVVTRFGDVPAHVEFFKSREHLIKEKANLVRALKKGGMLILNGDDVDVLALKEKTKEVVITYGLSDGSMIKGSHVEIFYTAEGDPEGIISKIEYKGNLFPLKLFGTIGKHYVSVVLAALTVGITQEINVVALLEALSGFKIPPGRLRILPGINHTVVIDDSYNSSPVATRGALRSLQETRAHGRKIAVLGDMMELGKYSIDEHKKIGVLVGEVCDVLITVGVRSKDIGEDVLISGMKHGREVHFFNFDDSISAGEFLKDFIQNGDIILIKGSQSMRMERAVEKIR